MIGLRLWIDPDEMSSFKEENRAKKLSDKFLSYISYLMISIYLIGYFDSRLKNDKGLDKYSEEEFKDMFEFESQTKSEKRKKVEKLRSQMSEIKLNTDEKMKEGEIFANRGDYTQRNMDQEDEDFN